MSVVSNARRIMSTNATRGENRFMLEEVYFSDIVQEDEAINNSQKASSTPNPYRAYKDASGYFHYQFPSLWYTSTSNNKAIGLRRIETRARAKNMTLNFTISRKLPTVQDFATYTRPFNFHFLPTDDIDTIMSTMCYEFNKFIESTLTRGNITARNKCYYFNIHYKYDDRSNEAMFYAIRNTVDEDGDEFLDWTGASFNFEIYKVNDDFATCFNMNEGIRQCRDIVGSDELGITDQDDDINSYDTVLYKFDNVWNRRFCFIHASFVSGTSFNYLGRSGDFYTKPSKMYKATNNTTDFTLSISFNGYTPIRTNEISFIVELAYIYTTGEYHGE